MARSATNSGFTAASHAHKADFFPKPPEPFLLKKGLALQGRAKERESHYILTYLCQRQHIQESQTCSSSQHQACSRSLAYCLTPRLSCLLQASQAGKSWTKRTSYPAPPTGSWARQLDGPQKRAGGQESQTCSSLKARSIRHAPSPMPLEAGQISSRPFGQRVSYPAHPPYWVRNDFNDDCPPLHMASIAQLVRAWERYGSQKTVL